MNQLPNTVNKLVSSFFGPWMRPPVAQCAAHTVRLWVSATLRRPLVVPNLRTRHVHTTRGAQISVADRIKQFLPREATEEATELSMQPLETFSTSSGSGLSAFSSEIKEVDVLVTQGELALACELLLEKLPLHVVLSALVDHIVPLVSRSPISHLGIYELAYQLHLLEQSALATQLLQSALPDAHDTALLVCEFEIAQEVARGSLTSRQVDIVVQEHTNAYFPRILESHHSPWLKTRLLAALDDKNFEIFFRRWSKYFLPAIGPPGIALLLRANRSLAVHNIVKTFVLQMWDEKYVNALVRATTTEEGFSRLWFQLRKSLTDDAHLSSDPVLVSAVPSILKVALKLRQTYDIANICRYGAAQLERHPSLLAKALLAAAFAQKRSSSSEPIVASPRKELETFLIRRVLTPVVADPEKCDQVIALTARRIANEGMPSRVFWQLVLSLPSETILGPRSSRALAPIVASRPYIEQLRYMALPIVSSRGICELLKLNVDRIVTHRRVNRISDDAQQSEEDVNLLMAGMVLASEKVERKDQKSQDGELARVVDDVFEPWKEDRADNIVRSAAQSNRAVASTIVQQLIHMLVGQKVYTVALQILRLVEGPQRPATLEFLLFGVVNDTPAKTYAAISWLLNTADISIPPYILNKVLIQLCQSPALTETQLKNQFQGIRRLMLMKARVLVSPEAAEALVEVLIKSSIARRGGSRSRLRWALDIAKMAKVPKRSFAKWTHELEGMQENQQGYWAD